MSRRRRDERGSVLLGVLGVAVVLSLLGTLLVREAIADLGQTSRVAEVNRLLQAAQAGIDDYVAKLTEDHLYFEHLTHPAESTRQATGGERVGAGEEWAFGMPWTYPLGRDAWLPYGDGMAYNLEIAPDGAMIRIEATARRADGRGRPRTLEALVRPASLADFQMIANRSITYGENVDTFGKIYAGIEERLNADGTTTLVPHNVVHKGRAHKDIYAEGTVSFGNPPPATPTGTLHDGALAYSGGTIRTVIRNPIRFTSFTSDLTDIKGIAAEGGGLYLAAEGWDVWWLTLRDDGKIDARGCDQAVVGTTVQALGQTRPTVCGATQTHDVPGNGAVWVETAAIVEGRVDGRFTIASDSDVIVGGSLVYERPGDDVVGLIAQRDMIVPLWAPTTLDWNAATLTINGIWRSWLTTPTGGHGALNFTGSTATNLGGFMSQYFPRAYNYDRHLLYLQPPYFPVLEEAYTVVLQREITG